MKCLISVVIVLQFTGLIGTLMCESDKSFLIPRTPSKLRHSPTSQSCFDRDIQPVFSESHVSFVLTWPQYGPRGREREREEEGGKRWAGGREEENGQKTRKEKSRFLFI